MILTLDSIKKIVTDYLVSNKICTDTYTTTADTVTGLVNQIGKIVTLQQEYGNLYPELSGDNLPLGKDIEEWFRDLQIPIDFDQTGTGTLAPINGTYRKTVFSKDLGKKTFGTTVRNDRFNQYALTQDDVVKLTTDIIVKLEDSKQIYMNSIKRQLLREFSSRVNDSFETATEIPTTGDTNIVKGNYYIQSGSYYIAMLDGVATGGDVEPLLANGTLLINNMITQSATPNNETTLKAWLLSLDQIMEKTKKESEGNSLSGNTLGVQNPNDLVLYVNDGLIPMVNQYKATILSNSLIDFKTQVKSIGDLGGDKFAILVDTRGVKVHTNYMSATVQNNAKGDFNNYFRHIGLTSHLSPNVFVHVWGQI